MIKKQKGSTLIEIVIAMVIIAIAVVAVLASYRITVINSPSAMTRKQATLIAENLMDEVLNKNFTKPTNGFAGPYSVANRAQFDTVTDYNNFSMTGIYNMDGVAIPELASYSASITVANSALSAISSSDSMLVTITVTGPHDTFTLKGYRLNYE